MPSWRILRQQAGRMPGASFQLACIKKTVITSSFQPGKPLRKHVFSKFDTFYCESISICERNISMICIQFEIERMVPARQSVKNSSDMIVIQLIDVGNFTGDIEENVRNFLKVIAMPGETERRREECQPGEY